MTYELYGLFDEENGNLVSISYSVGWNETQPTLAVFNTYYDAAKNVQPGTVIKKILVNIKEA